MSSLVPKPSASSHGSTPRTSINTDSILSQIEMEQHYTVRQELGRGTYGKCVLVTCKETGKQLVLKLLDKRTTRMKDFLHELNTSIFLSAHPHVIDAYSVAFETADYYSFALEFAPLGDLFEFIQPNRGLPEATVKLVVSQLVSALDFMHSQGICHRDLKPENVAVFEPDLGSVKLVDFGMARSVGTLCKKVGPSIPYTPPEIAQAAKNETYYVHSGTDAWSLGILIFCALTGSFPWQVAKESDNSYHEFAQWQRRKSLRTPANFREFTPCMQKLLRKLLEPKQARRAAVCKVRKYLDDDWTVLIGGRIPRGVASAAMVTGGMGVGVGVIGESTSGELSGEDLQQARLERMLEKFGVKTRVNRRAKEQRVVDWVHHVSPSAGLVEKPAEGEEQGEV